MNSTVMPSKSERTGVISQSAMEVTVSTKLAAMYELAAPDAAGKIPELPWYQPEPAAPELACAQPAAPSPATLSKFSVKTVPAFADAAAPATTMAVMSFLSFTMALDG